jgi:L-fuconate dehydratase
LLLTNSHLHNHFVYPVSINEQGRYNIPQDPKGGYSIEMYETSMKDYSFPNGAYWVADAKGEDYKSARDIEGH